MRGNKFCFDLRYLLVVAALAFIYIQMRLFATQSEYVDRLAAAIEAENHCTSQTRLLIDKISQQQGRVVALEEQMKRQDQECRQLRALVQDLESKGIKKLIGDVQMPVAAVVVMACSRADYLEKTIKSILKYQSSVASKYPLFISQDGSNPDVRKLALSYDQLTYMQHLDFEPVHTERPGELVAYYKIARHYKWALDQLFHKHNFSRVIILEDDMEIAADFFDYFEAGATLLDRDKLQNAYSQCPKYNIFYILVVNIPGRLWPFLLGMTMDKGSSSKILVSYILLPPFGMVVMSFLLNSFPVSLEMFIG
ncbi:hypothetical protein R3W88_004127 [Solanum pinnatisectum]|uniref:Alpha-1,3-mannosyl-glycoprotein 2-beta-N-acetylglucosaminyltransferase n=1 Tax=Solanum pinnatisectum TaxID=50273 RepID=A0AAV9MU06_9SOLN|nr:hypothetical protein R3W88_004127 [Solanum pinnatisectum]